MLFLFEVPVGGGEGIYVAAFPLAEAEKLVDLVRSWT